MLVAAGQREVADLCQRTLRGIFICDDEIDEAIDQDDPRIGEIIEALRWARNAPKSVRLFDEGDITGYASQPEADTALCASSPSGQVQILR